MHIVSCQHYKGRLHRFVEDGCEWETNELEWFNTNALLGEGWEGMKTGHTASAGSCLASYRKGVLIVVLNSFSH
jgi:D-alanyl-D-alanine carboxypeptidase